MDEALVKLIVELPVVGAVIYVVRMMLRQMATQSKLHGESFAAERAMNAESQSKLATAIGELREVLAGLRTDVSAKHADVRALFEEVKSLSCHPSRQDPPSDPDTLPGLAKARGS